MDYSKTNSNIQGVLCICVTGLGTIHKCLYLVVFKYVFDPKPTKAYSMCLSLFNSCLAGHKDGQVQFVMVKEANKVHFGVKGSNERLYWLQWLTRATGQSHKPSPPDATPNSEGSLSLNTA